MAWWSVVQAWWADKLGRDERGQGTTEYVLLILGVVLFLIVAALALQGILNGAIDQISTWVAGQNAP
jgi:Flp pilus assembly pilin Flp